jgi:hypothetical protein
MSHQVLQGSLSSKTFSAHPFFTVLSSASNTAGALSVNEETISTSFVPGLSCEKTGSKKKWEKIPRNHGKKNMKNPWKKPMKNRGEPWKNPPETAI